MRRDAQRLADNFQAAEVEQAYIDVVTREQFFAGGLLQDTGVNLCNKLCLNYKENAI